jgi:hypothetical protein
MLLPSKITRYKKSILAKFPLVLEELHKKDLSAHELFERTRNNLEGVSEYLEVLDCLFAMKKIELTQQQEFLHYVN